MTEPNKGAAAPAVAPPDDGATVHETMLLILRELRRQGDEQVAEHWRQRRARLDFGESIATSGAKVGTRDSPNWADKMCFAISGPRDGVIEIFSSLSEVALAVPIRHLDLLIEALSNLDRTPSAPERTSPGLAS